MKNLKNTAAAIKTPLAFALALAMGAGAQAQAGASAAFDAWASPWAVASGAEWAGDYARYLPMASDAGVKFLRFFPEWQTIQPKHGEWNWETADKMAAAAKANGMRLTGCWAYFAPWASADGGTRRGPVKDIQFWRDFTRETAARYKSDIRHWEVWNEFNGSFYQGIDKPAEYAALVAAAYDEVKKVDPGIKIGLSVANFDVSFLDAAIKAGAAGRFDFVAVHPYENASSLLQGGEYGYLSLAGSLRKMLAENKQRDGMELWITETGCQSKITPDAEADARQASQLVKIYILSLVQGFSKIAWFEMRGPAYGNDTDHGLIRRDWTPRPAYGAYKHMTELLGQTPEYIGWLTDDAKEVYGFVFNGANGSVLVSWKTGAAPAFKTDVSAAALAAARTNKAKPFPWGKDYSKSDSASVRLGGVNQDNGVAQVNQGTTAVVNDLVESWRRTDFSSGGEGRYVYFRTDQTFAGFSDTDLEITVVARRAAPGKPAGFSLTYESLKGYRGADGGYWSIPEGADWHERTWRVKDASFVGAWGWNFRTDSVASPDEVHIKEVRVKKLR